MTGVIFGVKGAASPSTSPAPWPSRSAPSPALIGAPSFDKLPFKIRASAPSGSIVFTSRSSPAAMRRFSYILTVPLAVILVVFAIDNRDTLVVSFWPFPWMAAMPAFLALCSWPC